MSWGKHISTNKTLRRNTTLRNLIAAALCAVLLLTTQSVRGQEPASIVRLPFVINFDAVGWITFASNRSDNHENEIWVMRGDGSSLSSASSVVIPGVDSDPSWSPDRIKIVYVSDRDGNHEIYTMNRDGSGVARLTNDNREDYDPAWSPDGTQIAFTRWTDNAPSIWLMDANGANPHQLTSGYDSQPSWSPDGSKIVFTRYVSLSGGASTDIYGMDSNGANVTWLVNTAANESQPAFAPDGITVAYLSNATVGYNRIWIRPAAGQPYMLTSNTQDIESLAWSPDGASIVYSKETARNSTFYNLYTVNRSTGSITQLTSGNFQDKQPDWYP
ncbi:MAG: hypothetical protein LLG44_13495 [Chloroflexi bacterium]|nr:hypothetical protein [Chloroflexota bacterium]